MFFTPSCIFITTIVLLVIFIDISILYKNSLSSLISIKASSLLLLIWITISCIIGLFIYRVTGTRTAIEYTTAYIIELLLSIDNALMFILIFRYFRIHSKHQHKILLIGVLSAMVLRISMINISSYIIAIFKWVSLPLSIIMIYSGYKLLKTKNRGYEQNDRFLFNYTTRYCHYSNKQTNGDFYFYKNGRMVITPLTFALLAIEKIDLIFALDSIPAILTVTKNSLILFSSNILAILSLRCIYLILSNVIQKLIYLKKGVGYILIYIGIKMIGDFFNIHFPILVSIIIILLAICTSIVVSMMKK